MRTRYPVFLAISSIERPVPKLFAWAPQVTASAQFVSLSRNHAALEQMIGRISLEPYVTAARWQAERAAVETRL